jgi:hypothetical protein
MQVSLDSTSIEYAGAVAVGDRIQVTGIVVVRSVTSSQSLPPGDPPGEVLLSESALAAFEPSTLSFAAA